MKSELNLSSGFVHYAMIAVTISSSQFCSYSITLFTPFILYLFYICHFQVLQSCPYVFGKKFCSSDQSFCVLCVHQVVIFAIDSVIAICSPFFIQGITPVLPIFREGILNGSQDVKEHAATGLGEVIQLTSADALKPSVVNITGPLIRILGDRFNWSVKVAILDTLGLLLGKVRFKYINT